MADWTKQGLGTARTMKMTFEAMQGFEINCERLPINFCPSWTV